MWKKLRRSPFVWMLLFVALIVFESEVSEFAFWLLNFPNDLFYFIGAMIELLLLLGNWMLICHFAVKGYKALMAFGQSYYTKQRKSNQ